MRIRPFQRADQREARALIQAGMRDRWGDGYDPSHNPDTDDLWTSYMTEGRQLLVARVRDGTMVGTGALIPEGPGIGRIVRMSVHHEYRRRGIALTLTTALISRAEACGWRRVVVLTDKPWTDAISLYERAGFTITHSDEIDTHLELEISAGR